MRYIVNYRPFDNQCGNKSFDMEQESRTFIASNEGGWISWTLFSYDPSQVGGIFALTKVDYKFMGRR